MKDFLIILKETLLHGIIPGSLIIVYKGNSKKRKFLLTKVKHSNMVTFPSGSIGWGENYKLAAIRELYEETGIKAYNIIELPVIHTFKYKNIIFRPRSLQHVFLCKISNNINFKLQSKETIWFGWENEDNVKKHISHKELVATFNKALRYL